MSTRPATVSARSVEDHRERVEELLRPLAGRGVEDVPMGEALGRVLATEMYAPVDLPVFRNSGMDGYAVRAESVAGRAAGRPPAGRRQFLRGRTTTDGVALASGPGSHLIAAMAHADVLIDIPAEVTDLAAGSVVKVWEL
ncbi:hypothetical protein [Nocardia terpenica]|uniref:Molybdopterin molybdenumtransferase n=1 Tax=Nocardia terpenica TaxID=455432 RepID=A0A164J623_9NOCA|nr:hypothetical protein [Nocardia terpenica]KZM70082.1 hypothetical protein AWN90_05760 [Nocardia terpenica]